MKIFNQTGIFAEESPSKAPEAGTQEAGADVPPSERAKTAIKRASEVMAQGKPAKEVHEPNAYEQYVALKLSSPSEAGAYWRANKQAIYACINN